MKDSIVKFFKEEEALTTVEYAVAGALVAAAVVTAFTALGSEVGVTINNLVNVLSTANAT